MNTNKINSKSALSESEINSNEKPSYLMSVPVTVDDNNKGTGKFYLVWDKKDFSGKPHKMSEREDDEVKNAGEEVTNPEDGQKVHLVRIKRKGQKRVWYAMSIIMTETVAEVKESAQ